MLICMRRNFYFEKYFEGESNKLREYKADILVHSKVQLLTRLTDDGSKRFLVLIVEIADVSTDQVDQGIASADQIPLPSVLPIE